MIITTKKRRVILTALILFAFGCGGGGGEDEEFLGITNPDPNTFVDPVKLLGDYFLEYRLVSNSCSGASPVSTFMERYTATKGEGFRGIPTIDITADNGLQFTGNSTTDFTDGMTFFSVTTNETRELANFVAGATCTESIELDFVQVTEVRGSRGADVVRTSDILCAFSEPSLNFACTVVYQDF